MDKPFVLYSSGLMYDIKKSCLTFACLLFLYCVYIKFHLNVANQTLSLSKYPHGKSRCVWPAAKRSSAVVKVAAGRFLIYWSNNHTWVVLKKIASIRQLENLNQACLVINLKLNTAMRIASWSGEGKCPEGSVVNSVVCFVMLNSFSGTHSSHRFDYSHSFLYFCNPFTFQLEV